MPATPAVQVVWHEYGDAGLLLDLVADDYEARWQTAQTLGATLRADRPDGLVDVVASFQNVFVSFDPLRTDHTEIRAAVTERLGREPRAAEPRRFVVPVVYGGEHGPDLDELGRELGHELGTELGLTGPELVDRHRSEDWVVRFTGSPVGAPMMDRPRSADPWLPVEVPRLARPRGRVESGSVGISGLQSLIYVAPSPGGWRLIGRTPARLFDLHRSPHVPYRPGDRIRFRAIGAEDWDRYAVPLQPDTNL